MPLFDLSVLVFFLIATIKVIAEVNEYWTAYDAASVRENIKPNPKHISAPVRKSPTNPNFRTEPRPQVAVKRPVAAKTTRVGHPVHANRKVRPAAAKKSRIAA